MKEVGEVLSSSNGIPILLICITAIIIFLILGKFGLFKYKGKGLTIGRSETELRAILMKQKEFVLQYCAYMVQRTIAELNQKGIEVSIIYAKYVMEKLIDQWLSWLLVNHISDDERYIQFKIGQAQLVLFKAIGEVDNNMLNNESIKKYFGNLCAIATKEIIIGLLQIYKIEN